MSEATERAAFILQRITEDEPLLAEREALVVALTAENHSLREVGKMLGLSHQTVANILARLASRG